VEIGLVLVDREGTVTDEWCSLVNPERDLGPQDIHRIQACDVRRAPTFADLAGDVAARLAGRVVVAHNLSFDSRFLVAEYRRLGVQVPLDHDRGLCTMALSGTYLDSPARSLASCCASAGIEHLETHSALHDARACAGLFARFIQVSGRPEPWHDLLTAARGDVWPVLPTGCGRTCRRTPRDAEPVTFLARLVDRLPRVHYPPRADDYLALLDRALLDRHISESEQDALIETAQALQMTVADAMELHRQYLTALAGAAWQDGIVEDEERRDLVTVAGLLGLSEHDVGAALRETRTSVQEFHWGQFRLQAGDRVAFTGQMAGLREEWELRATSRGLTVANGSVTKRTRVLVAADPDSLSGKAGKARQYGVPIITVPAFEAMLNQM
jgi:DNA polymerase III subunit epsilon